MSAQRPNRADALAEQEARLSKRIELLLEDAIEELLAAIAAGVPEEEALAAFEARGEALAALVGEESFAALELGRARILQREEHPR